MLACRVNTGRPLSLARSLIDWAAKASKLSKAAVVVVCLKVVHGAVAHQGEQKLSNARTYLNAEKSKWDAVKSASSSSAVHAVVFPATTMASHVSALQAAVSRDRGMRATDKQGEGRELAAGDLEVCLDGGRVHAVGQEHLRSASNIGDSLPIYSHVNGFRMRNNALLTESISRVRLDSSDRATLLTRVCWSEMNIELRE